MKKTLVISAAIVAAVTFTQAANAQSTASASLPIGANIVSPISITNPVGMNFGDVVPSATSGTVALSTAGARTPNGGVSLLTSTVSAAGFTVNGQANHTYTITLPTSAVTISDSASHTMTVDTFLSTPSGTGTLSSGGSQAVAVGATLHVIANQTPGSYSGSFDVTVTYN